MSDEVYVIEKIVAQGLSPTGEVLYKVRWHGFKAKDDTWEPKESFSDHGFIEDWENSQLKPKKRGRQVRVGDHTNNKLVPSTSHEARASLKQAGTSKSRSNSPKKLKAGGSGSTTVFLHDSDSDDEVKSNPSSVVSCNNALEKSKKGLAQAKRMEQYEKWRRMPSKGLQNGWSLKAILALISSTNDYLFCLVAWSESDEVDLVPHAFVVENYPEMFNKYIIENHRIEKK